MACPCLLLHKLTQRVLFPLEALNSTCVDMDVDLIVRFFSLVACCIWFWYAGLELGMSGEVHRAAYNMPMALLVRTFESYLDHLLSSSSFTLILHHEAQDSQSGLTTQ
jgi:hypothetical protein